MNFGSFRDSHILRRTKKREMPAPDGGKVTSSMRVVEQIQFINSPARMVFVFSGMFSSFCALKAWDSPLNLELDQLDLE